MALLFIGKLLIAVGICFQAYTLFEDKQTAAAFNGKLSTCLKTCEIIPAETRNHILEYGRLAVVGLLACSALMVVVRSCLIKTLVLIGLVAQLYMRHWPLTAVPSYKDQAFWGAVAIIGGIIYLMGADSCNSKPSSPSKREKVSSSSESPKSR